MWSWRCVGVLYVGSLLSSQLLFYIFLPSRHGYAFSHLRNLWSIVNLEFAYILGSIFIWERVSILSELTKGEAQESIFDTLWMRRAALTTCGVVIAGTLSAHLTLFSLKWMPFYVSWMMWFLVGVWLHLLVLLIATCVGTFLIRTLHSNGILPQLTGGCVKALQLPKRQALFSVFLSLILTALWTLSAQRLSVKRVEVLIHGLPMSFEGMRIALLSDIHFGPSVGTLKAEKMVDATMSLAPDLIVIVGDLADGSWDELDDRLVFLQRLRARFGVLFVTGNHEYFYGNADTLLKRITQLGIEPLRNNASLVKSADGDLCILGLDDISSAGSRVEGHGMDTDKAFSACPKESKVIVLAHDPRAAAQVLTTSHHPDLILCGHNHAIPALYMQTPYFYGLFETESGTQIFVGAGVNYWGAPMKLPGLTQIPLIVLLSE